MLSIITSIPTSFTPVVRRSQFTLCPNFRRPSPRFASPPINLRLSSSSSSSAVVESTVEPVSAEKETSKNKSFLGCPVCFDALTWTGDPTLESTASTTLECNTCKKVFYGNDSYVDLTAASGVKNYSESMPLATEFFRTPIIGFLYERGWRQNFGFGGFPGPEKEFELAKEYLKPAFGGNIVDASCGSGVFSRLFAKSGLFSLVIALDYSETMLRQCYEFVKEDPAFPKEKLILVRADISRLPFVSGSIDAVHAGAAIHCWPSPSTAVAEISRVLRPRGVFVASTTLADGPFTLLPFRRYLRENLQQLSGFRIFLSDRAVNGALVQSILTRPPWIAQSSAFQRLEYILIGWFFGKGTTMDSKFLNCPIGVEISSWVEPETELFLPATFALAEDIGVESVRLSGDIVQEFEVYLIMFSSLG
ncbi:hypothetical protein Cgig2_025922 [Carnegiea gigantea]|uniref:Methyltransferase type 11 domain-containing protein n=1 Tax=Carnegiea gigantea TaxID=171969 RepID=A0A9Q1JZ30_9CARY|nr:hypothetical protein Cgig2_025922 [Carnegiea gigantea]